MPGSGLIVPAHLLAKVGQALVKLGVRPKPERLDLDDLVIEAARIRRVLCLGHLPLAVGSFAVI
jgi:hypothetical protein